MGLAPGGDGGRERQAVRGRPRTSPGSASGGARTSRPHAPRPHADDVRAPPRVRRLGCADLPVRMGFAPRPGCGRGRPRTSPGSASGGARTSRSASGFAPRPGCGRGRPRTSPGSASGGARTSRSASGFAPRPECGRGRPRTSPGSASGGARTSRSASGFAPRPGCGRGRPRTSPGVRGPPGPSGFAPRPGCGRGVRAPPRVRRPGVRGPPGPHRASRQGRDADEDVRAPPLRPGVPDLPVRIGLRPRPGCGRGRPRTSPGSASGGARTSRSASGFAPRPGCGRGRPRTSPFGVARTSVPSGFAPRRADEDVRALPRVSGGARTSRPALDFVPERDADEASVHHGFTAKRFPRASPRWRSACRPPPCADRCRP